MENSEVIEHFYGVYLLYSMNPQFKGRIYIGFTVDPCRRLKEHNAGKEHKGARKTSDKGPWNMVLIIHGFLNKTSALSFEWAWQHPHKSRRLKHVYVSNAKKKLQQKRKIRFHLSVLSEMLKIGPWCRLPLTIRWLDYEFYEEYYRYVSAPMHMPICYGKIISKKIKQTNNIQALDKLPLICFLCNSLLEKEQSISCIRPNCSLVTHLICLARLFCKDNMILPIEGICPACNINVLWGDLIKKKIGCYGNLERVSNDENYT